MEAREAALWAPEHLRQTVIIGNQYQAARNQLPLLLVNWTYGFLVSERSAAAIPAQAKHQHKQ